MRRPPTLSQMTRSCLLEWLETRKLRPSVRKAIDANQVEILGAFRNDGGLFVLVRVLARHGAQTMLRLWYAGPQLRVAKVSEYNIPWADWVGDEYESPVLLGDCPNVNAATRKAVQERNST